MMRRFIVVVFCFLFGILHIVCIAEIGLTIVPENPKWAKTYDNLVILQEKYTDEGDISESYNPTNQIKIAINKHKDIYIINWYIKNVHKGKLFNSVLPVHGIGWSKNGKYLTLVKLTYSNDYKYNGILYIYKLKHKILKIYKKISNYGGNPGYFSRNSKYIAFGSNVDGLVIINLYNGKKINIPMPSNNGIISYIAWNDNDNMLFLMYVTPEGTNMYNAHGLALPS